jgi:hypothetical protein
MLAIVARNKIDDFVNEEIPSWMSDSPDPEGTTMQPSTPHTPRSCGPHATSYPDADPRPHIAALLALIALGWHVTGILPDRTAPVLWRVTIERYDGFASISVTEADPDAALEELLHYASADAKPDVGLDATACAAATQGPNEPSGSGAAPAERTPDAPAAGSEEP